MKPIAIIGAGFYGSYIALTLANKGHKILLIDPEDKSSATLHCQARLHSECSMLDLLKI